jgi:hypothetical protein
MKNILSGLLLALAFIPMALFATEEEENILADDLYQKSYEEQNEDAFAQNEDEASYILSYDEEYKGCPCHDNPRGKNVA